MSISEEKINYPLEILNYEKKIYDQRQLIEISRALNSTLDYKKLIISLTDVCLAQMQTLSAALFLTPEMDSDYIQLDSDYRGFELNQILENYKISVESQLIKLLNNSKKESSKTFEIKELEQIEDLHKEQDLKLLKDLGAHLIIPMKVKDTFIGLLVLGEKITGEDYTRSEKDFLIDLASLGAIAVYNAWLYERATVDLMTGLKNHAYFQSRLKEEREKALRKNSGLFLLLTDVDKFKNFNDTYGHQAGDEVLKHVAKELQKIAKMDSNFFAARYGGEEFCLVMPGIQNENQALEYAELFRKNVENMIVNHEGLQLKVTVSVGVARFDPQLDHKSNKNIIERADQALYECKKRGRNCVLLYGFNL